MISRGGGGGGGGGTPQNIQKDSHPLHAHQLEPLEVHRAAVTVQGIKRKGGLQRQFELEREYLLK